MRERRGEEGKGMRMSSKNSRSSMERRPIIPNRQIILAPPVSHLQIMVLRDMPEEVFEDVVGFFLAQFDDAFREAVISFQV